MNLTDKKKKSLNFKSKYYKQKLLNAKYRHFKKLR